MTYIAASTCLKVALGLLLLRIFVKRWMIYTIYAVMFVSVSYGLSYFFVVLFQCGNPLQYPERIIIDRQCLSHRTINGTSYTHAVITALADWIYAILPMIYLHNSKLIFRTKLSVGFILCIGSMYDQHVPSCPQYLINKLTLRFLAGACSQLFASAGYTT